MPASAPPSHFMLQPAFRLTGAALGVALLTFSLSAAAADASPEANANETTLGAVTVVGNWLENPNAEKVLEHPGARTIVDRQAIEESGATNVRDVLRRIPGVQVQDSNGTGGSDISLNVGVRGLTSRLSPRSTILMDGIPLAVAPYGQPQLSMAPLALGNLQDVDVVRGAGSVRYGPQNVGGIINFVSRAIPKTFGAEAAVETDVYSKGGAVKTTPSVFIGGTNDLGLGGAFLYSGTYGNGYRESNDHVNIDDVMLKGAYQISGTDQVSAGFHYYEALAGMPGGLTTAQYAADPFQSTRPFDNFSGRRSDVNLKYSHADANRKWEVLTYYTDSFRGSNIQSRPDAKTGLASLGAAPRNYHTFAVEPRYSQVFRTEGMSNEVSVGYRFLREASEEKALKTANYLPGSSFDAGSAPMTFTSGSVGGTTANAIYIDDTIDIGKWTITPGLRYEFIRSYATAIAPGKPDVRSDVSANEPLPSLSVMYHVTDQWNVFANAGVSFGPMQYFQITTPSTNNLTPEKAKTYEIGTHVEGLNGWGGELTLFDIDFSQELQLNNGEWTNLGATTHRGVEAGLRYDFGKLAPALYGLSAYATYTYTSATFDKGNFAGMDLPFYSRHTGTLGLRYTRDRWMFNVDTFAQSKQHSPGDPTKTTVYQTRESADGSLGDIPGYALLNLRAGYDFGKHAKLAVGIKNVFDRRYFTRSVDQNLGKYVGMPRTFYVQATLSY